ncbi:MAG TPA: serine hydrolase [Acetobacteraceae bacterium]|jgi:CubicO group peptidase (beta-lactamase class C family)|nr:serine hydrolase [Acetobacteraceae bacterium]
MTGSLHRNALWLALALSTMPLAAAWADDALTRAVDGMTFDQFAQKTLRDYDVPGAVVVVASADGPVFVKGYGVRRNGAPDPVDVDTRFQIASMSKFVAATAVATLVDRGVVSWDQPVIGFSAATALAVPYATENATLRDYFAHRTGLPAYGGDLLPVLGYSPDELASSARFLPFDHSFREKWAYSNYGIFLGQHAAAQAAGLTPPDLLATAIFRPLGMVRSGPTRATLFEDDNHAAAHNLDDSIMPNEDVDAFSGAGAIVSTGADIARWMQMLLADGSFEGRSVLSKQAVTDIYAASMVQGTGGPLHDPNDSAGLGCESYHFLQYRVIEKNGALNGVRTIVTLIPERRIGIAVFSNKQLTVYGEAVRAAFLERELGPSGQDLQTEIRKQQPLWNAVLDVPRPPADAQPLARDLGAFVGRYESTLYGEMTIARSGDLLSVAIGPAAYPGRLSHWSGDTFLLTFENPDLFPGLMTFAFAPGGPTASAIDGSQVPKSATSDFGHFARVQ